MAAHGKSKGVFVRTPDGGRNKVDAPTKGAMNEYIAMAWLMSQGYDVFRNASPVGRADLVATKWSDKKWIPIDVKSEEYDPDCINSFSEMALKQHRQKRHYEGSGVKYLIVNNDGTCNWYGENKLKPLPESDKYWLDPRSGQRFLHPRNDMKNSEWRDFCRWMLEYYTMDITQPQAEILRGVDRSVHYKRGKETLQKVRNFLYRKITGMEPFPAAANDNSINPEEKSDETSVAA